MERVKTYRGNCWITEDGIVGSTLGYEPIDPERDDVDGAFEVFRQAIQKLDPKIIARFFVNTFKPECHNPSARDQALSELGYFMSQFVVTIETGHEFSLGKLFSGHSDISESCARIENALHILKSLGLKTSVLTLEEANAFFPRNFKSWVSEGAIVDTGYSNAQVLRLDMGRAEEISDLTLYDLHRALPKPISIRVSVQRMSDHETEITLARRLKQSSSAKSRVDTTRTEALESAIVKTSLEGNSLFKVEFLVIPTGGSRERLKTATAESERVLSRLGQVRIETYGALPSLVASFPSFPQHVTFQESLTSLPFFLPITGPRRNRAVPARSALEFHRIGDVLGEVDLFDGEALNANLAVIGRSGRGKSALIGALTQALLNEPKVSILKVDVGGSHSKECQLVGGVERRITLNAPSGLNPFDGMPEAPDESHRAVLLNFISALVLEEGEAALTKEVRAEIDGLLSAFLKVKGARNLTEFWRMSSSFSRSKILSRWVEGGIFGNAFQPTAEVAEDPRLLYLNLSEIFQAGDPEFSQGIMAAVLAIFNLKMMKAFSEHRRLVLICDETPFFIQKGFQFFKFSVANVRKFGASVILVVQISTSLIQNDDHGIIDNCFHRILLSHDGDIQEFGKRFGLGERHLDAIQGLQTVPGKFSEFFYQFGDHGIKGQLRLTAEEYWRITTTQKDREKLENLMLAVPGLKLQEAIKCLSAPLS